MTYNPLSMLPSFLPDEILVSHFGRYASVVGGDNLKFLRVSSPDELSNRFRTEYFERYLKQLTGAGHSLRRLFLNHALDANQELLTGSTSAAAMSKGLLSHTVKYKYCARCAREDIDNYGQMYFRRTHQSPFVAVCPVHHVYLSVVSTAGRFSRTTIVPFVEPDGQDGLVCTNRFLIDVATAIRKSYFFQHSRTGVAHTFGKHLIEVVAKLVREQLPVNSNRRLLFDKRLEVGGVLPRFRLASISSGELGDLQGDLVASSEVECSADIRIDALIFLAALLGQSRNLIFALANGHEEGAFKLLRKGILEDISVSVDSMGLATLSIPIEEQTSLFDTLPSAASNWSFLRQYTLGERSKRQSILNYDGVSLIGAWLFGSVRL